MGLALWTASIGSANHVSLAQESQDRPPVSATQNETGNAAAFEEHFTGNSLRLELFLGGDAKQSWITLHQVRVESEWPGNRKNLIYPFPYGKYRVQVFAEDSKQLFTPTGLIRSLRNLRRRLRPLKERPGPFRFRFAFPSQVRRESADRSSACQQRMAVRV